MPCDRPNEFPDHTPGSYAVSITATAMFLTQTNDWRSRLPEGWPTSYLCFDVETSGFSRDRDVVLEWGHVLVHDGQVVDRLSVLLNWYAGEIVPASWLDGQLYRLSRDMAASGQSWHITPQRLKAEGVDPGRALSFIRELLETVQKQGLMLISHNGWKFDVSRLSHHFEVDLHQPLAFNPEQLLDTGAIEKAASLGDDPRVHLKSGESLKDFFLRVEAIHAPGLKWNLPYCVQKYKLAERFGLDASKLHSAGEDAFALHLLMQEYGRLFNSPAASPWTEWCQWAGEQLKEADTPSGPPQPLQSTQPPPRFTGRRQRCR